MLAAVAIAGLFLGSLLWAAVTDMFKDEVQTRLSRLPYLLIRVAALRLPRIDRGDLIDEWNAELDFVLHNIEGLPLTRLLRGVRFSADLLLRGAPAVAKEIKATGVRPQRRNLSDVIVYAIADAERTANLQRLIWSLAGILVAVVGSASAIAMVALHQRNVGMVSFASAAIAGIMGLVARIRRWRKRDLSK